MNLCQYHTVGPLHCVKFSANFVNNYSSEELDSKLKLLKTTTS